MDDLEEKMGAILNNPNMMQQIMSLAQTMGQNAPPGPEKQSEKPQQPPQDAQGSSGISRSQVSSSR